MKTYNIDFTGRKRGAIGLSSRYRAQRRAPNPSAAVLELYDEYEHIGFPLVQEVANGET